MSITTITIPKKLAGSDDLVVIPKRKLDALLARVDDRVTTEDVLDWSREARRLHRSGRLPKLA
jgi:hypothetical protein